MGATVTRLEGTFDEARVLEAFARERLRPSRWSNGPHDTYAPHSHAYHKVLYCLSGSIAFRLTGTSQEIDLQPGDRLDIEPRTEHSALVGARGVTCMEAPR